MTKTKYRDIPHYIPLIGVFTAGVLAFFFFSYDKQFQIGVALSLAAAHISWGIMHHIVHKDISIGIVIEYITVAILGLSVILSLLLAS